MAVAVLVFSTFVVSATRKLSDALEKAFRLTRQMERAHNISTRAAQTDELTGLMNRRAFFEHAHLLYAQCRHNAQPLCALMLDMDHFKEINDTYGHQAGDQVLRQAARNIHGVYPFPDHEPLPQVMPLAAVRCTAVGKRVRFGG